MACDLTQLHEDYFAIDPITGQIVPTNTAASPSDSLVKTGASKEVTHTAVDSTAVTVDMKDFTANTLVAPTAPCGTALDSTTAKRELYTRWNDTINEFEVFDDGRVSAERGGFGVCTTWNTNHTPGTYSTYLTGAVQTITSDPCRPTTYFATLDYAYTALTQDNARADVQCEVSTNGGAWSLAMNPGWSQVATGGNLQQANNVSAAITGTIPAGGASVTYQLRIRIGNAAGAANLVVAQNGCVASRLLKIIA